MSCLLNAILDESNVYFPLLQAFVILHAYRVSAVDVLNM